MNKPIEALVTVSLSTILAACAVDGSGVAATESRVLPAFDRVEVSAGLEVAVTFGPQAVVLTGDDNVLPLISTQVVGGRLRVEPIEDFDAFVPLVITVTAPSLLSASLSAGGRLDVIDVDADELVLEGDAGGTIVATGRVDRLTTRLTAGGTIDARDVTARLVSVVGGGGGLQRLYATEQATGRIESGSEARIGGNPAVRDIATASGGTVVYEP